LGKEMSKSIDHHPPRGTGEVGMKEKLQKEKPFPLTQRKGCYYEETSVARRRTSTLAGQNLTD